MRQICVRGIDNKQLNFLFNSDDNEYLAFLSNKDTLTCSLGTLSPVGPYRTLFIDQSGDRVSPAESVETIYHRKFISNIGKHFSVTFLADFTPVEISKTQIWSK